MNNKQTTNPAPAPDKYPFPIHCLPPILRDMATSLAECKRVPLTLPASCILAVVSSAIGSGLEVESAPGRTTRGNIFMLISAGSGDGKSVTFHPSVNPLVDYERKMLDRWEKTQYPKITAQKIALTSNIKKIERKLKSTRNPPSGQEIDQLKQTLQEDIAELRELEKKIHPPRLVVEDALSEAIEVQLAANNETLASLSADGRNIIKNIMGRYRSNKAETDEAIYLKAYSGDSCRVDRLGRDPVFLKSPCLTALWLIQPDLMDRLFAESLLSDSGLMPRFLATHSRAEATKITGKEPAFVPLEVGQAYTKVIIDLVESYRFAKKPYLVKPEKEAYSLFVDFHNETVDLRIGDLMDIKTFVARWPEQAWRLAVVLHAAEHGRCAHQFPLSVKTAEAAIDIAVWFGLEQVDLLTTYRRQSWDKKKTKILNCLFGNGDPVTARYIQRLGVASTIEKTKEILDRLEKNGDIASKIKKPKTGRSVRVYFLPCGP